MKQKKISLFLVAFMLSLTTITYSIKADEKILSDEEILELILRKENFLEDDEPLTSTHYEETYQIKTAYFENDEWDSEGEFKAYRLSDLNVLKKLPNLNRLEISIPYDSRELPSSLELLNELELEFIYVGIDRDNKDNVKLSEEQKDNVKHNQRVILDVIDTQEPINCILRNYEFTDYSYLIGLDLNKGIDMISNTGAENELPTIGKMFVYSHTIDDVKYYKTTITDPIQRAIKINEDNVIEEDIDRKQTAWTMTYDNEITDDNAHPKFYDVNKTPLESTSDYGMYRVNKANKLELFISEMELHKIEDAYYEDIEYYENTIEYLEADIEDILKDLETATDPAKIEELEGYLSYSKSNLVQNKAQLEEIISTRTSEGTYLGALDVDQHSNLVTDALGAELSITNRFFIKAMIPAPVKYKVTFDSDGGNDVDAIENIDPDSLIDEPSEPTKGNDKFLGWFKADGDKWNFETDKVNDNITLTAKWEPEVTVNKYTVTFNSQGGSEIDPILNVVEGSLISAPKEPVYLGYIFGGWYTDTTYSTLWNFNQDKVNSDITLYARWTKNDTPVKPDPGKPNPDKPSPEEPEEKTPPTGLNNQIYGYMNLFVIGLLIIIMNYKRKIKA